MIDIKDIIQSSELEGDFVIFKNDKGYFIGVRGKNGVEDFLSIAKEVYKSLDRREARVIKYKGIVQ